MAESQGNSRFSAAIRTGSGGRGDAVGYGQPGRLADGAERVPLGPRHPHLTAARSEPLEQGGAAHRIEMGGNLVEEQDRPAARLLGDEIGMGKDDADQQRLLLAGRAERSGLTCVAAARDGLSRWVTTRSVR